MINSPITKQFAYENDKIVFRFIAIYILLNSQIFNYSFFFFGLIPFKIIIHSLLFIIYIIVLNSYSRIYSIKSFKYILLSKSFIIITFLITFTFIKDLIISLLYNPSAGVANWPLILTCYFPIMFLINFKIYDFYKFLFKLQVIFFILSLYIAIQYTFPSLALNLGNNSIEISGTIEKVDRFWHTIYHFAMFSIFITIIQLEKIQNYSISQMIFIYINIIPQFICLFSANYRATILMSFLPVIMFILLRINDVIKLNFLRSAKRVKYFSYVFLFIIGILLIFNLDYILSSNWLYRLTNTENLLSDNNVVARTTEATMAFQQNFTNNDLVFGIGFLKLFFTPWYDGYTLHNGYFGIFYHFGIIGTIIFIFYICSIIYTIFKYFYPTDKPLFLLFITYVFSLLGQNFSISIIYRDSPAIVSQCLFVLLIIFYVNKIRIQRDQHSSI